MMYFDRDGKHNFVDENNVFLGYDNTQDCCEHADWYLADEVPSSVNTNRSGAPDGFDFGPYRFDATFFAEVGDERSLDFGNSAIFKIVAPGLPDKFIVLFNAHNGYYGHGFVMKHGGTVLRSARL